MTPVQIRVMIIDDHAVIRAGLRMLIEHDQTMNVVAMAGTRAEALRLAASTRPDIIILDLILGDDDGLTFLPELREVSPTSRVVVLTGVANPESHRMAIRRGAMGRRSMDRPFDDGKRASGVKQARRHRSGEGKNSNPH